MRQSSRGGAPTTLSALAFKPTGSPSHTQVVGACTAWTPAHPSNQSEGSLRWPVYPNRLLGDLFHLVDAIVQVVLTPLHGGIHCVAPAIDCIFDGSIGIPSDPPAKDCPAVWGEQHPNTRADHCSSHSSYCECRHPRTGH